MKLRYMMGAVAAALVLAGCGEDEIELVKNYTLPDFKSMSIGTAIEGSKRCKNITWSKADRGGLKSVTMVCDIDVEAINAELEKATKERLEKYNKDALNSNMDSTMEFYRGKAYDRNSLLQLANKLCKLNDTKFQETIKAKGKIEYEDQKGLIDCDKSLEDEILKDQDPKKDKTYLPGVLDFLKNAVYHSQLTPEQLKASYGASNKKAPSSATIELNFVVNNDKSVDLAPEFKLMADGKEESVGENVTSKNALAEFYIR
ncbi:hypothetical protein [uncultured Campylobacter sp.]|uniref:hypothetical protein n=1 Tax=uncultured Campylobacter sp. TaxID=218934 RepID=UPI00262EDA77|nr:hypothetical protein [uncultured Campylobacter sp.]